MSKLDLDWIENVARKHGRWHPPLDIVVDECRALLALVAELETEIHARRVLAEPHADDCPTFATRGQIHKVLERVLNDEPIGCTCGLSARQDVARRTLEQLGNGEGSK